MHFIYTEGNKMKIYRNRKRYLRIYNKEREEGWIPWAAHFWTKNMIRYPLTFLWADISFAIRLHIYRIYHRIKGDMKC